MQLSTAVKTYLDFRYNLSPRTRAIYREHLERLVAGAGDPPLPRVTCDDLCRFLAGLRRQDSQEYSRNYLDQVWRTYHTFFGFFVDKKTIPQNPMAGVPRPRLPTGRKPRLTLAQVNKLIHTIRATDTRRFNLVTRNLAIVLLMVDSGLRLNEVANLRAGDIFLDECTGLVYSQKTHEWRDVPLGEQTVEAIKDYLVDRPQIESVKEPIFLTAYGEPVTKETVHRLLKRLQKRAGFPLHAHLLRHTFAHHYNRKGNLRRLQSILGHSRIDTTARYYTDPEFDDILLEHHFASPIAQILINST